MTRPAPAPIADVFWLSLDRPTDRWWPLLDAAEQQRARALPTALLRRRFVVRRALIKQTPAHRTGLPVREVTITTDRYGRPELAGHPHTRFSISHSGPLAALAVTGDGSPVGVDAECLRADRATGRMLRYALTPRERAAVTEFAPRERPLAFHAVGTAKEAVAKATGRALARCFTEVDIALATSADGPCRMYGPCLAYDLTAPPAAWPVTRPVPHRTGYATALVTLPAPGETP
ncbi:MULTISPECIES: 4'-phosphopantetheinyl transferase family protein [unclassified Streptomyces]|uniref:4'-phosphopantetheinyl transferase family protein n=1 Tax=unclassified Streptomyces TaxID=2593676 RepID=UPI002E8006E0|nr:4'-phosphopantetheinyl transferase superfamily protein [Streptomyces sp. NBC_00589]WTI42151.1 4'-phosphopantetheinyl transferase superfamily protein [Streptomyces sp. NBC_00775]WUB24167.1 4'-phosphopantetheinyl transferase superfamily protein [Streptomyces sp. NBC_00589]